MGRKCQELWRTMGYALKYVVTHLCEGGLSKHARDLMFVFDWLLARVTLGPPQALVQDGNRVARVMVVPAHKKCNKVQFNHIGGFHNPPSLVGV